MCTPPKITSRGCRGNTSSRTSSVAAIGHRERLGPAAATRERRERGRFHLRQDRVELQLGLARSSGAAPMGGMIGSRLPSSRRTQVAPMIPGALITVATTTPALPARGLDDGGSHRGLDEHRDGAAARKPHLPRDLVGDAIGDEPGGAPVDGLADLRGHGALDAATGNRTEHRTRRRRQHHGAGLSRRAAPDLRDHGAPDRLVPGDQSLVVRQGLERHDGNIPRALELLYRLSLVLRPALLPGGHA